MGLRDRLRALLKAEERAGIGPTSRTPSLGEALADPYMDPHGGGPDAAWGATVREARNEEAALGVDDRPDE